jgi:hypothetical protein
MVNNLVAYFRCPVYISFTSPEIAALYDIIKQPINTISVILIVLCGIYSSLCSDGMGPAR